MGGRLLDPDDSRVDLFTEAGALRVVPVGEMDYAARSKLDQAYLELTERAPRDVVVDLSATSFLDSFGLGFLLRLQQWVAKSGHHMTIVAVPRRVRRALSLTGLDRILTVAAEPA